MTNTIPEPESVKPGENIPRKFYGNVLSRTVNNADGTVMLNDDSLTLSCPQVPRNGGVGRATAKFTTFTRQKPWVKGGDAHARGHFCCATDGRGGNEVVL